MNTHRDMPRSYMYSSMSLTNVQIHETCTPMKMQIGVQVIPQKVPRLTPHVGSGSNTLTALRHYANIMRVE